MKENKSPSKLNRVLKSIFKWLLGIIAVLLVLFLIIVIALQFPAVQTQITSRIVDTFSGRTGTHMSVDKVAIRLPATISISRVYVEDQQGDTLLYAGNIRVNVNIPALLRNRINVSSIRLDDVNANIIRQQPDTVFNFQFIVDAFASDSPREAVPVEPKDTLEQSNGMDINLGRIALNNIRMRFADYTSGMDLKVNLGEFDTRVTAFDPGNFIYSIDNTSISNTIVEMHMSDAPDRIREEPREEAPDMDLMVKSLNIENVSFNMFSADGGSMLVNVPDLQLQPQTIDISNNLFHLNSLRARDISFEMETLAKQQTTTPDTADTPFQFRWDEIFVWDILLGSIDVTVSRLSMITSNGNASANEFDPANLVLTDIVLDAENLVVNPQTIQLDIATLAANHPSGFTLEEFSAQIDLENTLNLSNLKLITGQSRLHLNLAADFDPLDISAETIENAVFDLQIVEGVFAPDLSFFYPPITEYLAMAGDPDNIRLTTNISGSMSDINLDNFELFIPELLHASLQGQVMGMPDTQNMLLNLSEINIGARPAMIMEMLPDTLQPQGMVMPDTIHIAGYFNGGFKDFTTQLTMTSDIGNITLEGNYNDNGSSPVTYQANVKLDNVDPGALLDQQETMGTVTASISLKGSGMEPRTATGDFQLTVHNALFNQYEYTDLELTGSIENGIFNAVLDYDDDNLALKASQNIVFTGEHTSFNLLWDLSRADLQALNFSEDMLIVRGEVIGEMFLITDDFARGGLKLHNVHVLHEDEAYAMENIIVETDFVEGLYKFDFKSPVLQAQYSGNISPLGVPAAIESHLNKYLPLPAEDDSIATTPEAFQLDVTVPPSDWLTELLMPGLSFPEPLSLSATFDSQTRVLAMESSLRQLSLGETHLENIAITASTDNQQGTFSVAVLNLDMGNLFLTNVSISGQFADSIIQFELAFDDQFNEQWLSLPGTLEPRGEAWQLSLDTDLIINRDAWQARPDNYIVYSPGRLFVNNFRLEREGKYLLIHSLTDDNGDQEVGVADMMTYPLNVSFHEFDLSDFSILEEEPLAGGQFNGFITVNDIFSDIAFTADLSVMDFAFRGDTIGDVKILASNPQANLFEVDASVIGMGNHIEVKGNYLAGDDAQLDVDLRLLEVNLASMEGLAQGAISGLSGNIAGEVKIQGEPSSPTFIGSLTFTDIAVFVEYLSAAYNIPDETITFDRNSIRLNTFTLTDQKQGEIVLDGSVNIADLPDIQYNLSLKARDFLMLDAEKGDNELFYGTLLVDTDLRLRGGMAAPVVDGRVALKEGSLFSFTIPQRSPEAIGSEGIVSFISYTDTLFQDDIKPDADQVKVNSGFQNLDLSVNIEVDPKTQLSIVIDEVAGDNLMVTGGGMMTFGLDPGGRLSLSGRYEISQGSYLLTFYDAIRRNFQIQSGSTIQWRGDPMDALVDITAIYSVRTSARELLISNMEDGGTATAALRQQFPFEVALKMDGNLQEPEISFGISLPPEHRNALEGRIDARLTELNQNESELNKQVFALLVLGNFIQENPLESIGAGPGLSSTARSSASRILSQQLNRLSDRYVKGVDVNFDIESYEDYTTGTPEGRTELQMEVSRDFLDERLRVTVGGNIELEDETRRESSAGEIAGDFLLEYLIDEDGNLILKAFRTKNYGDLFDGQVFETGVSLLFTRSYNVFREIFGRKKETKPETPQPDTQDL